MVRPRRKHVTWQAIGPIVVVVPLLLAGALVWNWLAGPDSLPAEQVRAALSGNTIHGGWGEEGTAYRQYFGDDGRTLHAAEGAPPQSGTWRLESDGRVCSALPGAGERCNLVGQMEQGLYWIDAEEGVGFPFEVMPGEQVTARQAAD